MKKLLTLVLLLILIPMQPSWASLIDISAKEVQPIELQQKGASSRIVALANGSAEIVSALGLRKSLVGRDVASSTPELVSVPIVTSGHQVIAEKVIALRPSLVLIDGNTGPKSSINAIRSAKINVIEISEAWNLLDMYKKVEQVAKAVGLNQQGKVLTTQMKALVTKSKVSLGWKPRIAFLYLRGTSSVYLMGGPGSGADSLISELGGIDVGATTLRNPFNSLTSEALVRANPDVLLLMTDGLKSVGGQRGLLKLPGVKQTSAGKAKRILTVDDSLLLSFGPRTPALLFKMAQALQGMK